MDKQSSPKTEKGSRIILIALAAASVMSLLSTQGLALASWDKPNVVVILTDDQGWGDLSAHGNTNIKTPNIDSLARDGALFERFYVCPVCAPTRAEFLTGRYHPRGGVRGVTRGAERLNVDEQTIGDAFKAAGYATAAFGKWHNGTQYPYHPNARGFDDFYGFCSGHWGQYFDPILERNGQIVRGKGFIIDDLTEHALGFMEKNSENPFFCYLAINTPHSPFQVPSRFFDELADRPLSMRHRDPGKEETGKTRCALAMCENIDWNVGRILKKIEDLQIRGDTILVFFTDNGPNSWRWNGDMKGKKGSTDEGGVRVPCLIRWPGRIEAETRIPQIAGAIDLLPTLTDLAGIPLPSERPLDGVSLEPLLRRKTEVWPDRKIFSHQRGRVSVRTQRHMLDHEGRLFDLEEDPGQRKDVSETEPETANNLKEAIKDWREEVLPENPEDDRRPFPVGYPEFPTTILPARDGIASGSICRSARAPNCSFFTSWSNTEDSITWDIELVTGGKYEVLVYYTCAVEDVGSTVEIEFQESRIQGEVAEAHDPPLVGAEFDRVPRGGESYVKDFRPLRLGVARFEKGRGPLRLRALEIPGAQVMDVRAVSLGLRR